jgi:DNA-directed RNA polymerase specialized sigma24 family protein
MPDDDDDRPEGEDEEPAEDDDEPVDEDDTGTPMTLEELRAFLGRADVIDRAVRSVGRKTPEQDVMDKVNDAIARAMRAKRRPSKERVQPWVDRVVAREMADHHRKLGRRKKHEGAMPTEPVRVDEAGEPLPETDDSGLVDADPSFDPEKMDDEKLGRMLRRYLADATAKNEKDRQTFEMWCEWADDDRTYAEVARAHGITESALQQRVFKLKRKYKDGFDRWRNSVFLLGALVGVVLAVFVVIIVLSLRRAPDARPDPNYVPPRAPSASASVPVPPAPSFDQALPPNPGPQNPPKPPKP